MTSFSFPSSLLACALLLAFLVLTGWRGARQRSNAWSKGILALLGLLALVFHLGVLDRDGETGEHYLRPPPMHVRELYHYYVGTKYFAELGYSGLYEATVIADQCDDVRHFVGGDVIRDLRTYDGVSKVDIAQRGPEIQARFSPERWALFREDIEMFRLAVGHEVWQQQNWLTDHGYNGSPVVTALLGGLANIDPIDSEGFLRRARWFDLGLFGLVLLAVFRLHGARVGLTFAFFWFVNPFNDYNYIGGAYLRYPFAYALALGLALFGRGRSVLSGAFLALSSMLRLFPGIFVAAVVLHHLVSPDRVARLRSRAPFYLSFVATSLLLFGGTWGVRTPTGQPAWLAFAENIERHAGSYGWNLVGLTVPMLYDAEDPATESEGADGWLAARAERVEARRPLTLAAMALCVLAIAAASRRVRPEHALYLGLPLLFVLQPAAHYYFAILGLLPLVFRRDRTVDAFLACGVLALVLSLATGAFDTIDQACAVASLVLGALLFAVLALAVVRGRSEETPGTLALDGSDVPQGSE